MVPTAGFSVHVTLAPEGKFRTENCSVPAGATVAVDGVTLVGNADAVSVKLAVPRTACVDEFVAVIVTVSLDATLLGAV